MLHTIELLDFAHGGPKPDGLESAKGSPRDRRLLPLLCQIGNKFEREGTCIATMTVHRPGRRIPIPPFAREHRIELRGKRSHLGRGLIAGEGLRHLIEGGADSAAIKRAEMNRLRLAGRRWPGPGYMRAKC